MPYPNEHAARVVSPSKFEPESFRRKKVPGSSAIMILGKLKGENSMTVQAYRFPTSSFTEAEARKWLKENKIESISFEPANSKVDEDDDVEIPFEDVDGTALKEKKDKADFKNVQRFDLMDSERWLTQPFERTTEGFLKGRAIVTSVGVFLYKAADGSIRRELRLPEEVFAPESLDTLKLKPLTNDHPTELVTPDNIKQYQVGSLGDNPGYTTQMYTSGGSWNRDNELTDGFHVAIDMAITEPKAISDVLSGKRSLSCGYMADLEPAEDGAVWCGMPYDYIQRRIRYNHVAIVDEARAGDAAQIRLDSAGTAVHIYPVKEDSSMAMKTIKLDGVEYQAEAEVLTALSKETQRADNAEAQVKNLDILKSTLEGERDSLKETLDSKNKEIDKLKADSLDPKRVEDAVKKRLVLLDAARLANVEITDNSTEDDIRKGVILSVYPNAKLDGKDTAYVEARFDAALEDLANKQDSANRALLGGETLPEKDMHNDGKRTIIVDSKKAREKMIQSLTEDSRK